MPIKISKKDLISLLNAKGSNNLGETSVCGVEFDSRRLKSDQLFVALKGETIHGHSFLKQAFEQGAGLALVEDSDLIINSEFRDRLIWVPDTLKAISELATKYRGRLNGKVIALTGSVGKTTTKEILASILREVGDGSYSTKSFNNHIGVPYTILNANIEDRWIALELGMNHPGELHQLSLISQPDIALIVGIAPVHIEFFDSIDAIADAKCEILDGLRTDGSIVLNGDDDVLGVSFKRWASRSKISGTPIYYGTKPSCKLWVDGFESIGFDGIKFNLHCAQEASTVKLPILGLHNAMNACGAALAALTAFPNITLAQIRSGIEKAKPPAMRLNIISSNNGPQIIDDSYNASPASMSASIRLLSDLAKPGEKIGAILGDMLELGKHSERYHAEIGELLMKIKPSLVIGVGPNSKHYLSKLGDIGVHVDSPEAAARILQSHELDLVLIKGSRGIGLDRAVKQLQSK